MKALIIHFICPNMDGFHGKGEYVAYALIPGYVMLEKIGEEKLVYSYYVRAVSEGFILRDDPDEAWLTALGGAMVNFGEVEVIKYAWLCRSCRAKGVKS